MSSIQKVEPRGAIFPMANNDAEAATRRPITPKSDSDEPMVQLSKYILLLATLVATVTYAAGFNPPGGVWQEAAAGRPAGDPIIRSTNQTRYLVFFYCNATAFASSLVVIVLVLFLTLWYEKKIIHASAMPVTAQKNLPDTVVVPLRGVMVLDLLSLMGAYAAGTCRDTLTTIYSSVLVTIVLIYLVIQMVWAQLPEDQAYKLKLKKWLCDVRMPFLSPPQVEASVDPQDDASVNPQDDASVDPVLMKRLRKVLMLLATFAVSVTYVAGMSTPGGFWDSGAEGGHHPGDAILKDRHPARLTVFFCCNTMAFVASLLIIVVLLNKKYRVKQAYVWITVTLISLAGAYTAGSCRQIDTTVYVVSLVLAVLVVIAFLQASTSGGQAPGHGNADANSRSGGQAPGHGNVDANSTSGEQAPAHGNADASTSGGQAIGHGNVDANSTSGGQAPDHGNGNGPVQRCWQREWWKGEWWKGPEANKDRNEAEKARSLVLLLATLAATITYQAGLDPPGGVWPENGNGYMAGDPILLTMNPRRYKAFFYCNSVAFVASLVAIILVQKKLMLKTHVLEAAMILDLFGLIGAYAAGSCRDVSTSIYAIALAGAVLVYVVIHVVFFTLDHTNTDPNNAEINDLVEKRRKRLLLFAVLAATITYQAGLTPPGGFLLQDDDGSHEHGVGDPVLLHNFYRRYVAFFYCNSVSFMLSIALIILLVNPHLYRPAIRSYALAVCTAAGMFGLMGAYAAGSTQYIKTSIYIFVLVAAVVLVIVVLLLIFLLKKKDVIDTTTQDGRSSASCVPEATGTVNDEEEKKKKQAQLKKLAEQERQTEIHAKRKYLMLLGILVASVTYQAGLDPPGGAWQRSGDGHEAGNPVLHDSNRPRYLTFFYSNSTSFVASIVVIILLLLHWLKKVQWSLRVMNKAILLDLFALLVAYAAGSSRGWQTSVYAVALIIAVLTYVAIHIALAFLCACRRRRQEEANAPATTSRTT